MRRILPVRNEGETDALRCGVRLGAWHRWIRDLVRTLASEGRTVFLSSHLMSEMAVTADHLIVLGRIRVLARRLGGGVHPTRRLAQ